MDTTKPETQKVTQLTEFFRILDSTRGRFNLTRVAAVVGYHLFDNKEYWRNL